MLIRHLFSFDSADDIIFIISILLSGFLHYFRRQLFTPFSLFRYDTRQQPPPLLDFIISSAAAAAAAAAASAAIIRLAADFRFDISLSAEPCFASFRQAFDGFRRHVDAIFDIDYFRRQIFSAFADYIYAAAFHFAIAIISDDDCHC